MQSLLKQGLLPSIIRTMLTIMATPRFSGGGEEEEGDVGTDTQSPISLAAQVMMSLVLSLYHGELTN